MKKNETKIFDTAFQGIVAVITVRKRAIPIAGEQVRRRADRVHAL